MLFFFLMKVLFLAFSVYNLGKNDDEDKITHSQLQLSRINTGHWS